MNYSSRAEQDNSIHFDIARPCQFDGFMKGAVRSHYRRGEREAISSPFYPVRGSSRRAKSLHQAEKSNGKSERKMQSAAELGMRAARCSGASISPMNSFPFPPKHSVKHFVINSANCRPFSPLNAAIKT